MWVKFFVRLTAVHLMSQTQAALAVDLQLINIDGLYQDLSERLK